MCHLTFGGKLYLKQLDKQNAFSSNEVQNTMSRTPCFISTHSNHLHHSYQSLCMHKICSHQPTTMKQVGLEIHQILILGFSLNKKARSVIPKIKKILQFHGCHSLKINHTMQKLIFKGRILFTREYQFWDGVIKIYQPLYESITKTQAQAFKRPKPKLYILEYESSHLELDTANLIGDQPNPASPKSTQLKDKELIIYYWRQKKSGGLESLGHVTSQQSKDLNQLQRIWKPKQVNSY